MSGHGGARKNAGRRAVEPDWQERFAICLRCEELRETTFRKDALDKAGQRVPEKIKKLRETIKAKRTELASKIAEMKRRGASALAIRAIRDAFERYETNAMRRINTEITPVLDSMRRRKIHVRRMTWEVVQRKVAQEYRQRGRFDITPRRVKAYRLEYTAALRAMSET